MKNRLSILLLLTLCPWVAAVGSLAADEASAVSERTDDILRRRLNPQPKELQFVNGFFLLDANAKVAVSTVEALPEAQRRQVAQIFDQYWQVVPQFSFAEDEKNKVIADGGYEISIEGAEQGAQAHPLAIAASDFTGVRDALKTLRQFAEMAHGGKGWVFQACTIKDAPSLKFRSIHICMFPETTLEEIEKYVRLAAYYKFNAIILEPWGTFPFESHPEFAFQDKKYDRKELKRIVDLCHELGITPIPQFSILGHAWQSRRVSGKHAVLVASPELSHLYEPLGWTYCIANPQTREVLKDLVIELHEFFGNPPLFHLGCDEAFDKATCHICRDQDFNALFVEYLSEFNQLLNDRGARAVIWHDMLLRRGDPRWKKHVSTGNAETAKLVGMLPNNIIIADWQYSYQDAKQTEFVTPQYFKNEGFDVIVCPWQARAGIYALAKEADEQNLFGFMATTWHTVLGEKMNVYFASGADAAWNGGKSTDMVGRLRDLGIAKHMMDVERDAKITKYESLGRGHYQISKTQQ